MRTNVEVDDELMARAMRTTGISSRAEVINAGLRRLLDLAIDGGRSAHAGPEPAGGGNERTSIQVIALHGRQTDLDVFGAHLGFGGGE